MVRFQTDTNSEKKSDCQIFGHCIFGNRKYGNQIFGHLAIGR